MINNSIQVYIQPFLLKQKVYSYQNNILKEHFVNLSDLPDFIVKYMPKQVQFFGDLHYAEKIAEQSEYLLKKNNDNVNINYNFNRS